MAIANFWGFRSKTPKCASMGSNWIPELLPESSDFYLVAIAHFSAILHKTPECASMGTNSIL
jgi:hypothetical protein